MEDEITTTRDLLYAAFLRWEQDIASGNVMDPEEFAALTLEGRAEASTRSLLDHLKGA